MEIREVGVIECIHGVSMKERNKVFQMKLENLAAASFTFYLKMIKVSR